MTEKFRENRRPLLSVIVPVYNGAAWLRETLESIKNSRYENLELLLIDDGSADGSGEICREYERKDPRIRYIRKENGGIVSARNLGLDAAGGTYLCFCDQDDEVDERMYDILIRCMEEAEAQIGVCSTGRRINGEKSRYESVTDGCFRGEAVLEAVLYPILFRGYEFPFYKREHYLYGTLWKCVFRRDFLKAHGMRFRSFVDYEDDWLFVTEALCHAGTVVTAGRIGYYWTVNETSRSHKRRFIPDLGERFGRQDAYVMGYLERRISDREILDSYRKIRMCEHYVEALQNEPDSGPEKRAYRRKVRTYLESSRYREQMSCLRHLGKHAYRRRLVCDALQSTGIGGASLVSRLLNAGEAAAVRIRWLAQLERRGKIGRKMRDSGRNTDEIDYSDSVL